MIIYKKGDVTEPTEKELKFLIHVVNNKNVWKSGVVVGINNKWPEPEKVYRATARYLGEVQFVPVEKDLIVCNMCAQNGIKKLYDGDVLLSYTDLKKCLSIVKEFIRQNYYKKDVTIIGPKFGSGRGGADWNEIAKITEEILGDVCPIVIYVWDE